jgi:hypothetical protein
MREAGMSPQTVLEAAAARAIGRDAIASG